MRAFKFCLILILASGCVTEQIDNKNDSALNTKTTVNKELASLLGQVKGEYLDLNIENIEKTVKQISLGDIDTIKKVMDDPNAYEPPILFAYAEQVYNSGFYETALFWFYTAQLRARSDANKSFDKSVQTAVTAMSSRFAHIGQYGIDNYEVLPQIVDKVVEWDKISERKYDPKWVAILGNESKISDKIRFRDSSEYEKINAEVRRYWKLGFESAYEQIKKMKESEKNTK